jgi:hypothetical protein
MASPHELIDPLIKAETSADITTIDGGWRIKENPAGTHYVDVLHMLFNFRIVLTPKDDPSFYVRHWCYSGNNFPSLMRTIAAAIAWDGGLDTEPDGWNKSGQTGERRQPA